MTSPLWRELDKPCPQCGGIAYYDTTHSYGGGSGSADQIVDRLVAKSICPVCRIQFVVISFYMTSLNPKRPVEYDPGLEPSITTRTVTNEVLTGIVGHSYADIKPAIESDGQLVVSWGSSYKL